MVPVTIQTYKPKRGGWNHSNASSIRAERVYKINRNCRISMVYRGNSPNRRDRRHRPNRRRRRKRCPAIQNGIKLHPMNRAEVQKNDSSPASFYLPGSASVSV
ncbi:MAG: hypothetical protein WCP73_09545 [Eubacteriales bacterium]